MPKKPGTDGDSGGRSTTDTSPLFTVISLKVGGSNLPNTDAAGTYYSKYDPLTITGACRGGVETVKVQITPLSQATVTETVPCSSTLYTWTKSLTTETSYTIVLSPLDASGNPVSALTPVTKNYVYDVTNPAAPAFLTPTTATTYSVSNGQTAFTITGQVLNEVSELMGPGNSIVALTPNADNVHQDFSYSLNVAVGSSVAASFLAIDKAGNSSTSTMTIASVLGAVIPVASMDAGGKVVTSGLVIHSNAGYNNGLFTNSNVKFITGSAGIVGNSP